MPRDFHGAKGALLIGDRLLVLLRDDFAWIAFPSHWDFPGGGREGCETPREAMSRETREEVDLDLGSAEWLWEAEFPSATKPGTVSWFFLVRLPASAESRIVLGDEGQAWRLVAPADYLTMDGAIPFLQERLKVALSALGSRLALP